MSEANIASTQEPEGGDLANDPRQGTSKKKDKKRLTISQKRLKKVVNVGLMKWRMEKQLEKNTSQSSSQDAVGSTVRQPTSLTNAKIDELNQPNVYEFNEDTAKHNMGDEYEKVILEEMEVENHQLTIAGGPPDASQDPTIDLISGRYVVDGQHFFREMRKLENHRFSCHSQGYYKLLHSEVKNLVWTLKFQCPICRSCETILSDPTPTSTPGNRELSISDTAVWGTIAIGGGHANMEELFTTMGVKSIDKKTFAKKENELGNRWRDILFEEMLTNGRAERQLAIENGDVDENGNPFITVVVDGGWSHRSHGHRYTSNSGVACVIGLRTKKLLHVFIRNKYCSMCIYLEKQNKPPSHEGCYKNWEGTSQGMESDMLVEAFRSSKQIHRLEYRTVIGDGDSSVFVKLQQMVSYGLHIQKSECANHAVKNYCKALFSQKHLPQAVKKILSPRTVQRLKKDARYAIYHIAETTKNAQELRDDLINGPAHVLGIHQNCKEYFCRKKDNERELVGFLLAAHNFALDCLKPLLRKAHRLVHNDTSNLAENLMSLVAKFSGGKQINRCKRGSYQHRCNGAALDYQLGASWTYQTMKTMIGKSPSSVIKKYAHRKTRAKSSTKRSLINCRKQRTALRYEAVHDPRPRQKDNTTTTGTADYGPLCQDLDMAEDDYVAAANLFKEKLNLTDNSRQELEKITRGQAANELWFFERRSRLTASHFGEICKRRPSTPSARLVETLIYAKSGTNSDAVQYGNFHERDALQAYQLQRPEATMFQCGLFVHKTYGFLGASPDSLVDHDGIVEVKCPYSARTYTLEEAVLSKKFCLDKNGSLPKTHNYFYQIQGQLEIADRAFCDLVVWGPKFTKIIRIERDQEFWKSRMLPKLLDFFERCLLPELVDPRKCRSMPLRDSRTAQSHK